jgi:hypothetical protein
VISLQSVHAATFTQFAECWFRDSSDICDDYLRAWDAAASTCNTIDLAPCPSKVSPTFAVFDVVDAPEFTSCLAGIDANGESSCPVACKPIKLQFAVMEAFAWGVKSQAKSIAEGTFNVSSYSVAEQQDMEWQRYACIDAYVGEFPEASETSAATLEQTSPEYRKLFTLAVALDEVRCNYSDGEVTIAIEAATSTISATPSLSVAFPMLIFAFLSTMFWFQ